MPAQLLLARSNTENLQCRQIAKGLVRSLSGDELLQGQHTKRLQAILRSFKSFMRILTGLRYVTEGITAYCPPAAWGL